MSSFYYSLEEQTFMDEYYFCTGSCKTTVALYQNNLKDTVTVTTMKRVVAIFQNTRWKISYILDDHKRVKDYMEKNTGTFTKYITQKLAFKHKTKR